MATRTIYEELATLLTYPSRDYPDVICAALAAAGGECRERLEHFAGGVRGLTEHQLQELFTSTFDLNPVCSLELGWHLFGENYERGQLLVRIRGELRRYRLEESTELPDHLAHVLLLLGRMEHERAADFAAACVLPATRKMIAALRGKNNPYENVLEAIQSLIHTEFPEIPLDLPDVEPLLKVLI